MTKQTVLLGLKAEAKEAAIAELIDVLAASGKVKDPAVALRVVMDREKKMSTGLQDGLAIPHGKTDCVDCIAAAIGIKPAGVEFDSLDGLPARIIVLTLSPVNKPGPHIQFLADIGKALGNPAVRAQLVAAASAEEVIAILHAASSTHHAA